MPRLRGPLRREQLMQVATKLFAERGYDATTTAAIAEAAGVTEPVLYRHFAGKREMFAAILNSTILRMIQRWGGILQSTSDPATQIRAIAAGFPKHVEELHDDHRLLHGAIATARDEDVKSVLRAHYDQFVELFAELVRRGQAAGIFQKDIDAVQAAWLLVNLGTGYAFLRLGMGIENVDVRLEVELAIKSLCV